MTTRPRYWLWHHWRDEQGRPWATPFHFDVSHEARRAHVNAAAFAWVTAGMIDPHVSALYALDGRGVVTLQQDCSPGDDPRREQRVTSPPEGLGQVSSVVKAEAQRRDPGSIPGESTHDLPF